MLSISISKGKGSMNHNLRKFTLQNVDPSRSHLNIVLQQPQLKQVYQDLFGEALQRYNDRQRRADRQIDDYIVHILGKVYRS